MSPVDDFLETFAKCGGLLGDYNVPNLSREKRGEVSFFAKNISFSKILNRYRIAQKVLGFLKIRLQIPRTQFSLKQTSLVIKKP